jgi:phage terminase large subunit
MYGYYSFPDIKLPGETLSIGQELANELSSPHYEFNKNGAVKVESKKDMKKLGIASPNIADALGVTEFFYSYSTKIFKKKVVIDKSKHNYPRPSINHSRKKVFGENSWMTL